MIERIFYVYLHKKQSDGKIFYIGKGKHKRAFDKYSRSKHWKRVVNKYGVDVFIIKSNMCEPCSLTLEKIMIHKIGINNLVNTTLGGNGASGFKHSEKAKKRIGDFWRGRKLNEKQLLALKKANDERIFTNETRLKMSLAKKEIKKNPLPDETKLKISKSHIGIRPSKESLKKMSESKKGKYCGKNNGCYDHTIRNFYHDLYGEFIGTRGDLILKYNLANGCISELINLKRKTVKGWRLI